MTGISSSTLTSLTCDRASVPISERSVYSYDTMNRVIAIDHPAGTDDISYTYEADGALKTATTQGSTWTYAYNKRRLPTQESLAFDSQTFNITWGYDGNGTANNLTYPSGLSIPFNPNALGEPQQIGSFASNISYHPNGALAGFTYGNNVLHSTTQNARQLPLRSRAQFNGSSIVDYTLTFDPNANPTLMSDGVAGAIETKSMTYDGLDRLVSASATGTFGNAIIEYDPLDNIRRYAVNGRDWRYVIDNAKQQLTRINNPSGVQQVAYTYDPRGNMTSRNDDGITLSFNFDRAQRLLDNKYLNQVQQSYRYDAHGRRTESAQPNGDKRYQIYSRSGQFLYEAQRPAGSPGQTRTTDYLYLGGTLIAKRVIEDIVVVPVLFKDGFETPAPVGAHPGATNTTTPNTPSTLTTTITYLHTDPLGSPVAETNTLGDVIKRNRFEPFGYPLNTPTEGQPSYTGHQFDSFTELHYAQQRYYDSKAGKFPSIDPMAAGVGNFNRYNYAANSPYKNIDPDGRQSAPCPTCPIIGTAQTTGTAGHAAAGNIEAAEMAASGEYSSVHLNRPLDAITGDPAAGKQRPDIGAVRVDTGGVDTREHPSDSQSPASQDAKGKVMQEKLGAIGKAGSHQTNSISKVLKGAAGKLGVVGVAITATVAAAELAENPTLDGATSTTVGLVMDSLCGAMGGCGDAQAPPVKDE